jgi:hypothetical protein
VPPFAAPGTILAQVHGFEYHVIQWTFANWAFKPPNAQFVKITTLAAQAFSFFAKGRLAV